MTIHAPRYWRPVVVGLQILERVVAVVIGLAAMIMGMGLTVTIVFLPAGLVLMLGGLLLTLVGLFEHSMRALR